VANSKALALAGITAATPDPPGGHIRRRAGSNEPDGVLEENAQYPVIGKLIASQVKARESQALLLAGLQLYAKYGFTTAQDGLTDPANVQGYMAAAEAGRLNIDVVSYPGYLMLGDGAFMDGPYYGRTYKGHFRIGGIKLTLDGSPQGKTAWLTKPYLVPPAGQKEGYAGYPALKDAQVDTAIEQAFAKGWQVLVHTNGDAALDQLLNAVEGASKKIPGTDRRPVAIHAQTARLDQVDRMKALGVIPSFFPMHTFYWGDWHRDSVLGPERAANISPTGWALQRGMIFTSHHDAPVVFPDAMRVIASTVNRTTRTGQVLGPDQRVEPIVALKATTLWAAHQHFEEKTKGSIEPGKLADLVVVSDNPLTIDRAKLADITVLETIKEGKSVYTRPGRKIPGQEE
jgi:predicted amidohydrolase YtcJ